MVFITGCAVKFTKFVESENIQINKNYLPQKFNIKFKYDIFMPENNLTSTAHGDYQLLAQKNYIYNFLKGAGGSIVLDEDSPNIISIYREDKFSVSYVEHILDGVAQTFLQVLTLGFYPVEYENQYVFHIQISTKKVNNFVEIRGKHSQSRTLLNFTDIKNCTLNFDSAEEELTSNVMLELGKRAANLLLIH